MANIILNEFDVHRALKNLMKRRGDVNEDLEMPGHSIEGFMEEGDNTNDLDFFNSELSDCFADSEPVDDEENIACLKESIKKMIHEHIDNMGGMQQFMQRPQAIIGGDVAEKHHVENEHEPQHVENKNNKERTTKRAIVINWLRSPKNAVNCAEIMRQLWHPSPEEEDTKRGEFYKKRDGAINKESGARYSFTDAEINQLYRIKSNRS